LEVEMNKKEKQPPQVINLAGDLKNSVTEIIKVGRRRYRVEKTALDASPLDYIEGWRDDCLRPLYCLICGFELGFNYKQFTLPQDVLCVVHRHDEMNRRAIPRCVYCAEPMRVLFPFEVGLGAARFLWVCADHHCFIVTESLEGVK
jgi:hypothetical protein